MAVYHWKALLEKSELDQNSYKKDLLFARKYKKHV